MRRDKLVKTQRYDITILLFDLYVWLKFVVLLLPAFADKSNQKVNRLVQTHFMVLDF